MFLHGINVFDCFERIASCRQEQKNATNRVHVAGHPARVGEWNR
jgi:hypothetical protein